MERNKIPAGALRQLGLESNLSMLEKQVRMLKVELGARNSRPKLRYAVIPIWGSVVAPIEDPG